MESSSSFALSERTLRRHYVPDGSDCFIPLHDTLSVPALWRKVSEAVQRIMPLHSVSAYCNYFDCDGAFRLFHRQCGPGALLPWTMRQAVTPTPGFLRENAGVRLFRLREMLPSESALLKSDYYREVMRQEGWRSLVCLAFWDQGAPFFMLVLRRTVGQPEFDPGELPLLQSLYRHLEVSLRRIRAAEKENVTGRTLAKLAISSSEPLLLADWDGRLIYHNAAGREAVQRWSLGVLETRLHAPDYHIGLPPELVAACQRLREEWKFSTRAPQRIGSKGLLINSALVLGGQAEVQLVASRELVIARPLICLRFLHPKTSTRDPALSAKELSCLSRAELTVAETVAAGMSNKAAAARLGKSVRTLKAQLTQVYHKLGIEGRSQLILRLKSM